MTMKEGVYIFAVVFVIHLRSAVATTLEKVWLKDVTTNFLTDKRTLINTDFPDELAFHLTRRSETLNLNLRRNHDINPNPDFYFARKLENGQFVLIKSRNIENEDVAYYQDIKNGAFMTVRCTQKSNEQCDRIISGNVRIGNIDYELQPAETDVVSRNMLEDPSHLGRQYVLEDQTHTEKEYSVEIKDAAQENTINLAQHLRRFQEQHKQKHLSSSVDTLSSRNVSTLHNRGGTDKSRQIRNVYYVKVAVVMDSGLWNFYLSTVHALNPFRRELDVEKKIKQLYSHVMNGVDMVYNGIEDPRIKINVILSEFIIFKTKEEFPHIHSAVVTYNGKDYIDVEKYHDDLIQWDRKTDMIRQKTFNHGMLFTRYDLYHKNLSGNDIKGLCYTGEVCNVGTRMSVVEQAGLVWMVYHAAHELGHSLGANHDGEGNARDCKASDGFIMSPTCKHDCPGTPYAKNRWVFSKCSVRSFKKTLKNKMCLKDPGNYYDDEYHRHLIQEPGEVYPVAEQCELINGRRSVLCETVYEDICLLMRCTDPNTGRCIEVTHGAARGTKCGINKWCIDGLCVPKRKR